MEDQDLTYAISDAEQFLMDDDNYENPLLDASVNRMVEELGGEVAGNNWNPIPIWPVPPSPHNCTCCETLRQIFHVNDSHVLKLHIHGRLGLIAHAVLEKYGVLCPENREHHMFDEESIVNVKKFLVQYCDDRKREGYIMLQDPLFNFYSALCTFPDEVANGVRSSNSNLSLQRERTGNMKVRDLVKYFHMPINAASKELNICPSAIKSICRKEKLHRWPYRKIKSIQNEISKKQQSLNSRDAYERANASAEIEKLQRELDDIYRPFNV